MWVFCRHGAESLFERSDVAALHLRRESAFDNGVAAQLADALEMLQSKIGQDKDRQFDCVFVCGFVPVMN